MNVAKDRVVTLEYTLSDADGRLIDSSDGKEPLSLIQGRGSVFPAIEEAIADRSMGEQISLELAPEQAYGPHDERLLHQVPRDNFRADGQIAPGMQFLRRIDGEEYIVTVHSVDDQQVTIDANHPLAGKQLRFELVITGVREALEEELRSGQIQELDEIYAKEATQSLGVELR